jgi:hypothetical protein
MERKINNSQKKTWIVKFFIKYIIINFIVKHNDNERSVLFLIRFIDKII